METADKPVESLLETVKQLSPDELAEFTTRLTEWQESGGGGEPSESFLVRLASRRLSHADAARLRRLTERSERGELSPSELEEYRQLARRSERLTASRLGALAELARRRGQPVDRVKQEIDWPCT